MDPAMPESLSQALQAAYLMLDAATLSPLERIRLSGRLGGIGAKIAAGVTGMESLKLARELADIRDRLGAAAAPAPAPATEGQRIPFGLQASGLRTREKLNAAAAAIIGRVRAEGLTLADLTDEERATLAQYSGRGGLTDNSQSEYYTPTPVAEGCWELLSANGFKNGNVLEPSTGAGVFSATKPAGVLISGAEIDDTSAAVAQLLHPEDRIANSSFERFALSTPDGSFDAVNGNVPFGVRGAESHHDEKWKDETRLERYFVRRVVDKVRPGGLICLIVPVAVIGARDRQWARWRAELSLHAEFLGGHKLPSKTFGKQGTDVVTDIIVLRRHTEAVAKKIADLNADTLRAANVLWDEFIEGRYFQGEGKRFIHGTFVPRDPNAVRSEDRVIADDNLTDAALKAKLAAPFDSRIDYAMLEAMPEPVHVYAEGDRRVINGQAMELRGGKWVVFTPTGPEDTMLDSAKFGVASLAELEQRLRTSEGMLGITAEQAYSCWKRYPHLFTGAQEQAIIFAASQPQDKFREVAYRGALLGALINRFSRGTDATDRDRIIQLLTDEYARFGHPTTIKGMVIDGEKAQLFGVYLGAVTPDGKVTAIVTGDTVAAEGFKGDNILSIVTHLTMRSDDQVGVSDIKALYTGPLKLEQDRDLAEVEGIAITPSGGIVTLTDYCSGDAYAKVAELQGCIEGSQDQRMIEHWKGLINALMSRVKRSDVQAISFGLRDNWVPPAYKIEFLRLQGYALKFIAEGAEAEPGDEVGEGSAVTRGAWALAGAAWVKPSEFQRQLVHYMGGLSIGHNMRDNAQAPAAERKDEYQRKVNDLEEQFKFFMRSHTDSSDLAATYDMTFNRHIPREYSTAPLGLVQWAAGVVTHTYQNAGVRRLSDEGNGILGYDVGLGKTFTSLAYSSYDRQMGRSKKHCFVVPKSVLANWYNESKKALGSHTGVLFVGFEPKRNKAGGIVQEAVLDENGKPKKNEHTGEVEYQDVLVEDSSEEVFAKMHTIPAMQTGIVVMTYEKFKDIPLKPQTLEAYADKWVERSMTSAANAKRLKGEEKKKPGKSYADAQQEARIGARFGGQAGKVKRELPYFEDMGFDRVIVDEAHNFRASFQVKEGMDKLAYLPNPQESQRAQDMAMKLSYLREANGGKGSILLTATPVANSPIEIYNMMMHVVPPEELDALGIYTPADFVRFFGVIEQVQKLTVSGAIEPRDGLKGFRNLNILRGLFNRYANMMGAKDVDPDGNVLKLPEAQEVKSQAHMTAEQHQLYVELRAEAKKSGNPKSVASGEARPMFAVLRDMDRVTTDVDLYRRTMTFLFKAGDAERLRSLIADLPPVITIERVDEETEEKVKIDIPRAEGFTENDGTITYVAPEEYEFQVVTRLKKFSIGYVTHPVTPKYAELIKNLKAELATGGKQLVFTEEKSQHGKLERLLLQALPEVEGRIGIINADTAGGEKLQQIVDAYTRGDFKIIICNKKAEVGVNLQRGTTAVHHMTLPWTPASIQQRNGRAVRQGNKVGAVRIYYYQAAGSFDEYRHDLLTKKANWINALLDKSNTEDEHDNEDAGNDAEHAALLSENREEFLAKMAAEKAKRDAEARERRDQQAKIQLIQLQSAANFLATFDQRKASAVAEAEEDAKAAERSLERARGLPDDDPKKAETILRREANLRWAQGRIKRVAQEMDQKRADTEARSRQLTGSLKAAADRGDLPFSAAVVNNPSQALLSLTKVLAYPGGIYEVENPNTSTGRDILTVTKVAGGASREVTVEFLYQASNRRRFDGEFDWDKLLGKTGREVAMDADAVADLRLVAKPIRYSALGAMVSREKLATLLERVRISGYALMRGPDGRLMTSSEPSGKALDMMVYPSLTDEATRKELADLYGQSLGGNRSSVDYGREDVMPAFFGEQWKVAIGQYLKLARQEDAIGAAKAAVAGIVLEVYTDSAKAREVYEQLRAVTDTYSGRNHPAQVQLRAAAAEAGYANADEFMGWALNYLRGLQSTAFNERTRLATVEAEAAKRQTQEAASKAAEAAKGDARYRELLPDQVQRFAALGIKARYNNNEAAGPAFPPFAGLMMHDTRGYGGVLRRVKDMMKPRFKAQWVKAAAVPSGSQWADNWGVPSTTSVDDLLAFLEN